MRMPWTHAQEQVTELRNEAALMRVDLERAIEVAQLVTAGHLDAETAMWLLAAERSRYRDRRLAAGIPDLSDEPDPQYVLPPSFHEETA